MSLKKIYPPKDPQERLSYAFNWTPRNLGSEQITSIVATVISGTCVVHSSEVSDDVVGARAGQGTKHVISGGADGELCEIRLHAVTDAGSEPEQTVYLPIRQK